LQQSFEGVVDQLKVDWTQFVFFHCTPHKKPLVKIVPPSSFAQKVGSFAIFAAIRRASSLVSASRLIAGRASGW
jgi:hypothetical protein